MFDQLGISYIPCMHNMHSCIMFMAFNTELYGRLHLCSITTGATSRHGQIHTCLTQTLTWMITYYFWSTLGKSELDLKPHAHICNANSQFTEF